MNDSLPKRPQMIMMQLEDYQRLLRTIEAQAEALCNLSEPQITYLTEDEPDEGELMN